MIKEYITFKKIQDELKNRPNLIKKLNKFSKIVIVTRGGLVVGGLLSQYLATRWYDTACITSYIDKKKTDIKQIKVTAADERVLIIDDIVDTGKSIEYLTKFYPNSSVFVLHYKSKSSLYKPDYYLWETANWIVYPWEVNES